METAQRAVLFVDVADSTKIYESLGDTVALAVINGLFARLDRIIAKYSGSVVKTLGDGMVCVFGSGRRLPRRLRDAARCFARARNRLQIKWHLGSVILSRATCSATP